MKTNSAWLIYKSYWT